MQSNGVLPAARTLSRFSSLVLYPLACFAVDKGVHGSCSCMYFGGFSFMLNVYIQMYTVGKDKKSLDLDLGLDFKLGSYSIYNGVMLEWIRWNVGL